MENFRMIPVGALGANCYIIYEESNKLLLVIDPGDDADLIISIYRQISQYGVKVSSLARGLGFGDNLEYADELTLGRSIVNRQIFKP